MEMEKIKYIERKIEQRWEDGFSEKWEQNFAFLLLFFFIIFGVLFFVFIIPRMSPVFSSGKKTQSSISVSQEDVDPVKNYSAGVKLSDDMNYSAALSFFQKAVEKDPKNVNYLTELAMTHYRLKNYDEAIKVYDKLIEIDGGNGSSYDNRIGNIYWIEKQYDRAEFYFRRAIEKNPRLSVSYSNLAIMLSEEKQKDKAIEVLKSGIADSEGSDDLKTTLLIVETSK
jgi:tetratricopeptide (TPR) repeat protein